MPELPDVEIFRRYLDATSLHQKIENVQVHSSRILKGISAPKLKRRLTGHEFDKSDRHGKYLFARTDKNLCLVLHFGMTGFLKYFKKMDKKPPHVRLLVTFSQGYHLAYDCQRKLGEVHLIDKQDTFIEKKKLGPDPLAPGFDLDTFKQTFTKSRAAVKSAFMNQSVMAGIGNIYADEILFQAGIHPKTSIRKIKEKDLARLFEKTKRVLTTAIECRADPEAFPDTFIIPHRQAGGQCPRCGGTIESTKLSGRTTYYCPTCQGKKGV